MKKLILSTWILLGLTVASAQDVVIDGDYIFQKAKELTGNTTFKIEGVEVRIPERGSVEGRALTHRMLLQEFANLGYQPMTQTFGTNGVNILAQKLGKDTQRHIVISCHLDNMSNEGANDNASGMMIMLAVAKALANQIPEITVKFAAFDLEEVGLLGSKAYVEAFNSGGFVGNINMDMIGVPADPNVVYLDHCNRPDAIQLSQKFMSVVTKYQIPLVSAPVCRGGSDHASFWSKDLPAFRLAATQRAADDSCYHQQCDKLARLNFQYIEKIALALTYTVKEIR